MWHFPEVPCRPVSSTSLGAPGLLTRVEGNGNGDGLAECACQVLSFFFFLLARCTVARFVRSSGKAFSGLTELPATTEGESSRGGFPQGHKAGLSVVRELEELAALFNPCTGVV